MILTRSGPPEVRKPVSMAGYCAHHPGIPTRGVKHQAEPRRRRVLVHLIGGTGYPAQMAEQFGTTRANLSNHLACLRECGLVTATAEGRRVRYALADDRLADGLRILAALDLPGCYE